MALGENENRNRMTGAVTDHIFTVRVEDGQAVETVHGPACVATTGYTADEFSADPLLWIRIVHPEDVDAVQRQAAQLLSGRFSGQLEHRIWRKDGALCWVRIALVPRFDGEGRLLSYDGLVSDITERKLAQQAVEESEQRFRALLEHSSETFTILDSQGISCYEGPSILKILGYGPEELVGRDPFQLVHPDDLPMAREGLRRLLCQPRATQPGEYRVRHKDGSWRVMETTASSLLDEPGIHGIVINSRDITDRRKAESALRESEERFKQVAENAFEWIWEVNAEGLFTYSSPTVEKILGYNPEEIVGRRHFFDLVHPDEREEVRRTTFGAFALKQSLLVPHSRCICKDGREVWLSTSAMPVLDQEGGLVGYRGLDADVTDRTHAEETLQEERRFLDALIRSLPGSFFVIDTKGRLVRWNQYFEEQSGVPSEQLSGVDTFGLVHEEDRAFVGERLKDILENGDSRFEARVLVKIGQVRPYFFNARRTTIGTNTYAVITGLDIGDWRRAEQALRDREASLASATENAPCMIYQAVQRADGAMYFPYASAWCREKLGIEPEALRVSATPLLAHVLQDDRAEFEASIVRSAQTMELWNHEFCGVDKTGDIIRLNGISKPELRTDGCIQWNGVLLDVTQRWRAETERQKLEVQLAQAQKMESIGRLAGGVAHDFNNVLTAILGYTELELMRSQELDCHVLDSLREIRKAGERARSLTRQLLAYGRKQTLETRVLDLNDVILSFSKMLHRLIGEDIRVKTILDPSIGMVRADVSQIEQVLMNVAVNARDAMLSGGVLSIETSDIQLDAIYAAAHSEVTPGDYVMLSVGDSGCGMDAETLKMAFEPFFTTKEPGKGTGLGLATVYGIVKQHNGHIFAYSEPGIGTTIKIYLPRVTEAAQTRTVPSIPAVPVGGAATILVVEDDAAVRRLIASLLVGLGYDVIEAEGGPAAILLAAEHERVQLLVTDVIMPEMNGHQVHEKLRAIHPDIRVLYVSGYTANIIAHRGILDDGVQLLQKPFTVQALAQKVHDVIFG